MSLKLNRETLRNLSGREDEIMGGGMKGSLAYCWSDKCHTYAGDLCPVTGDCHYTGNNTGCHSGPCQP